MPYEILLSTCVPHTVMNYKLINSSVQSIYYDIPTCNMIRLKHSFIEILCCFLTSDLIC